MKHRRKRHQSGHRSNQRPVQHQPKHAPIQPPLLGLPFVIVGELSAAEIKGARHTRYMQCGACADTSGLAVAVAWPGENGAVYLTGFCWPCVLSKICSTGEAAVKGLQEIEVDIDCSLAEIALAGSEAAR